jgi:hypothetical protein
MSQQQMLERRTRFSSVTETRSMRLVGSSRRPFHHTRSGFVLILVIIAIAIMGLAVASFAVLMSTELQAARIGRRTLRKQDAAASAEALLASVTAKSFQERAAMGGLENNPLWFQSKPVNPLVESEEFFSVYSLRSANELASEEVMWGATNESAKLNLRRFVRFHGENPIAARTALQRLPGMNERTAYLLLDLIDEDALARDMGAESHRRSPMWIGDLMEMMKDSSTITEKGSANILFDDQDTRNPTNRSTDRISSNDGAESKVSKPMWLDYVTLTSAERNETKTGDPRIQLNRPDLIELHRQLSIALDPSWANFVVLYRQYGPAETTSAPEGETTQSKRSIETSAALMIMDFSIPGQTTVASNLDLIGAVVEIPGNATEKRKRRVKSPLGRDRATWPARLLPWLDATTTDPRPIIEGRININQASLEVLLTLDQIDIAQAERILATRNTGDDPTVNRFHAGWLLAEGIVDLGEMKDLESQITCGGDVFSAKIVGGSPTSQTFIHREIVIDGTRKMPRRLYFKDLDDERLHPLPTLVKSPPDRQQVLP